MTLKINLNPNNLIEEIEDLTIEDLNVDKEMYNKSIEDSNSTNQELNKKYNTIIYNFKDGNDNNKFHSKIINFLTLKDICQS